MGLYTTAIRKATLVPCELEDCSQPGHVKVYEGRLDGRATGCYVGNGPGLSFSAGSYSGYNNWREQLSQLMLGVKPETVWRNPDQFKYSPFVELIHFSDCEGSIGPDTSRKLHHDFMDHMDIAATAEPWFTKKYMLWNKAFALAADNGFVDFH